jgi:cytochrome c-type biogenesis protein CcmH/NrfG
MKYKNFVQRHWRKAGLVLTVIVLGCTALSGWRWTHVSESDLTTPVEAQQQTIILEQRLSQIEQRFNYVESRLNRLESESRFPSSTTTSSSIRTETDLNVLRAQVDELQTEIAALTSRLTAAECAIVRLDERTLTPATRALRKRTAQDNNEPCRLNYDAPIRIAR